MKTGLLVDPSDNVAVATTMIEAGEKIKVEKENNSSSNE